MISWFVGQAEFENRVLANESLERTVHVYQSPADRSLNLQDFESDDPFLTQLDLRMNLEVKSPYSPGRDRPVIDFPGSGRDKETIRWPLMGRIWGPSWDEFCGHPLAVYLHLCEPGEPPDAGRFSEG